MKPVQIIGAIGVVAILAMGAWYMYMQQAPLPEAAEHGGVNTERGLKIPAATGAAKPAPDKKAEAPEAKAPQAKTPSAPTAKVEPAPAEPAKPDDGASKP